MCMYALCTYLYNIIQLLQIRLKNSTGPKLVNLEILNAKNEFKRTPQSTV